MNMLNLKYSVNVTRASWKSVIKPEIDIILSLGKPACKLIKQIGKQ